VGSKNYRRSTPLGPTGHNVETCVRTTAESWTPPAGDGPLIYVSLGSLGSADVALMERLVAALAATPYRYIVSKGPQHDQYELAANMIGTEFLPQVAIFWDQHDNAQRVHEQGFGVRLPIYTFADDELAAALSRVLDDEGLHGRATAAAERLQRRSGTGVAAALIERVAATGEPVTRRG
jgi:UDP:flavonoid glycosyltransferase YjiC (YdhE family)